MCVLFAKNKNQKERKKGGQKNKQTGKIANEAQKIRCKWFGSFNICQKKPYNNWQQQQQPSPPPQQHSQWVSCFSIILRMKIHLMRAAINLKLDFMAVFLPLMYEDEAKKTH